MILTMWTGGRRMNSATIRTLAIAAALGACAFIAAYFIKNGGAATVTKLRNSFPRVTTADIHAADATADGFGGLD